jgi:formylglycine-generating enzyme required for sulfatase activity
MNTLGISFRVIAVLSLAASLAGHAGEYVPVPAGELLSVLANDADPLPTRVEAFDMRVSPVTNAEFLQFLAANPKWHRGAAPRSLADASYLSGWKGPAAFAEPVQPSQPVVNVSWFAAQAFCEQEGARLPTWLEWEYVAAADPTHRDARKDPAWRAGILAWYSQSSGLPLGAVGGKPNVYGVRDLHALVWEWVDDFNALLVSVDSRNQGDPDKLQFCGAGAISLKDRDNYAVLMRIALLSSLKAVDTTNNLGFRCVRSGLKNR